MKISVHYSRKQPGQVAYSSHEVSASLEEELGEATEDEARQAFEDRFALLKQEVERQLAHEGAHIGSSVAPRGNGNGAKPSYQPQRRWQSSSPPRPANGNGRQAPQAAKGIRATPAQCKAVSAISRALGLDVSEVLADYGVDQPSELNIRQASELIDELKAQQGTAR